MGMEEEAGKTVRGFMTTLKDQPLSLALVVMNISLLVLVAWNARDTSEDRKETAALIIAKFRETDQLLSKCTSIDEVRKLLHDLNLPLPTPDRP